MSITSVTASVNTFLQSFIRSSRVTCRTCLIPHGRQAFVFLLPKQETERKKVGLVRFQNAPVSVRHSVRKRAYQSKSSGQVKKKVKNLMQFPLKRKIRAESWTNFFSTFLRQLVGKIKVIPLRFISNEVFPGEKKFSTKVQGDWNTGESIKVDVMLNLGVNKN